MRRWLPYAAAAAGSAVLVALVLSQRGAGERAPAARPPDGGGALDRSNTGTALRLRIAAGRAERTREPTEPAPIARLSELDRTPEEHQLLWIVQQDLVADCMRRRGFTYLPNPPDDLPDPDAPEPVRRPGDVESARTSGYGLFEAIRAGPGRKPPPDQNAEQLARMTSEQRNAFSLALRGPPIPRREASADPTVERIRIPGVGTVVWSRDSCLAEARRRLYGEDYEHNEIGYTETIFLREIAAAADADADYRKGLDAWRDCMRASGFEEEHPMSAADRLAGEYHQGHLTLDELRAHEVSVATADAECHGLSNLAALRQAAEERAERDLAARNQQKLTAMKQARQEALQRAESLFQNGTL